MGAFKVEIGNYSMDDEIKPLDSDGNVISGRPNPTRITWTKEHKIQVHEIPWPSYRTCRTSSRTLWKLDLDFVAFTKDDVDTLAMMADNCGPYMIRTAFKSMNMYIQSFTATAEAGFNDYRQTITMKLVEMYD